MKIHKLVILLSKSHEILEYAGIFHTSIRSQRTFSVVTFPQHTLLNIGPGLAFELFVTSRPVGSPLQIGFFLSTEKMNTFSNKCEKQTEFQTLHIHYTMKLYAICSFTGPAN